MRHSLRFAATRFFALCLFGAFAAPKATGQIGLELALESGGAIGQTLVWSVDGQDSFAPLARLLGVDFETLDGGLDLPEFGLLHLALTPSLILLPGQEDDFYSLAVPQSPVFQGLTLYAQAIGPALGAPPGTLLLSNLVETTISDQTPVARFAHTLCLGDGTVHTMGIDGASGKLRSLGFVSGGDLPVTMAASADGRFVWVVDTIANQVRSFELDGQTGHLNAGAVAPCDAGTDLIGIDPSAQVLLTASSVTDRVRTYGIDLATGAPTPITVDSAVPVNNPFAIEFHAVGDFAYVLSGGDQSIISFRLDQLTGTLSEVASTPAPQSANRLLIDAKGRIGIALGESTGEARLFAIAPYQGTWSPLGSNSTFLAATLGAVELVELDGEQFLYADEPLFSQVSAFRIDPNNGSFQSILTQAHGGTWTDIAWDGGSERLLITDAALNEVCLFELSESGNLIPGQVNRTRATPIALALSSGLEPLEFRTRSLFVAHEDSSELRAFQILGSNALLLDQGGGVFNTQVGPVSVALASTGDLAVTGDFQGDGLTSFPTNVTLGQLGTPQTSEATSPFDIQFDPRGRFLYATSVDGQRIEIFERQTAGAGLFPVGSEPLPAGSLPQGLAIDPSGRFLYVACSQPGVIDSFRIDPDSGLLIHLGASPVTGAPVDVSISPDGRFLYSVQQGPDSLSSFSIDPATGFLLELGSSFESLPAGAIALEIEPCGRFLYTASNGADRIVAFRLDLVTGAPERLAGGNAEVLAPGGPCGLACEANGDFLFVSRNTADQIDSYAIDPGTGALTLVSATSTVGQGPRGVAAAVELD